MTPTATPASLFANIPSALTEELFESIAASPHMRIERIVSRGHASAEGFWYEQPQNEWVMVVKGEAVLRFEQGGRSIRMKPGDHVTIGAGERHRVDWTSGNEDTIWLAVFYD
jgi:cupin 2 domain-containing protein